MTITNNQESVMNNLCNAAIRQRLGDISDLPEDLVDHILNVYCEFVASYLNMLRQKENKPADWTPDRLLIDSELADGMRHFFSDYQHITKALCRLNKEMDRLQAIDKDNQPNLYQHMIDDILKRKDRQVTPGEEYENTG